MTNFLSHDASKLADLLGLTVDEALDYLTTIDERPPAMDLAISEPPALPADGLGAGSALELFRQRFGQEMPASNGPRFWGFVTGGTTPAALMGDWLTSAYDLNLSAAANSNAPNIEWEALSMLRTLFGLPDTFHGTFVTGATMSNFAGLALARTWAARQHGYDLAAQGLRGLPEIPVLSGEAHSSVFKALVMLGLGRNSLRPVETLPGDREAVDVAALREALIALDGQPAIVVANAGTVNTGDFDDLVVIAALREQFPFWLHVDGAFGGFAACSRQHSHLLVGLEQADSLTIDGHKWLNVPYDAAMLFTRHQDLQVATFQNSAAYLGEMGERPDFVHLGPENSRRLRALPVWFTLLAYGRAGYRQIVEENCRLARLLGQRIDDAAGFHLLAPVRLNVACFTLAGEPSAAQIVHYLARLRDDGRVFLTPTSFQGRPAIRAALSNWRTTETDLELAWQAMNECLPAVQDG